MRGGDMFGLKVACDESYAGTRHGEFVWVTDRKDATPYMTEAEAQADADELMRMQRRFTVVVFNL